MITVKHKEIYLIRGDNSVDTIDTRYNLKCSIKKIIKYCIKHSLSFRVGIRDNAVIRNKNYIEIISSQAAAYLCNINDDIVRLDNATKKATGLKIFLTSQEK